jgi:hypothetical protein|tara:strand:- start:1904 stop:2332 length:429 start_codon:yes stop_codon:yes gene_type:complete
MSYVLERDFANTNFMQNKMIASNTNAIALHSDQLVKAGQDLTYFGEKVTELDQRDQNIYDNINFNIDRLNNLQAQINEAKDERDTIQTKISNIGSGMGSGDCAFWDVPCKMKETTSQIGTIALLAGGGFVLYKVLSGRRKLL